jgi:hypothetical protein
MKPGRLAPVYIKPGILSILLGFTIYSLKPVFWIININGNGRSGLNRNGSS